MAELWSSHTAHHHTTVRLSHNDADLTSKAGRKQRHPPLLFRLCTHKTEGDAGGGVARRGFWGPGPG